MTNCPNCGAPVTGSICEYCGTVHGIQEKQVPSKELDALILRDYQMDCMSNIIRTLQPIHKPCYPLSTDN